jgi:hypothetical protein
VVIIIASDIVIISRATATGLDEFQAAYWAARVAAAKRLTHMSACLFLCGEEARLMRRGGACFCSSSIAWERKPSAVAPTADLYELRSTIRCTDQFEIPVCQLRRRVAA